MADKKRPVAEAAPGNAKAAAKVLVTGDFVLDHHIYEGRRHHFGDLRHRGVREVEELGGAALVHYLLAALGRGVESRLGVEVDEKRQPLLSGKASHLSACSAYAFWRPFPRSGDASPENEVWRVAEAMGFGGQGAAADPLAWVAGPASAERADVVVLSDGGMGFRGHPQLWPATAFESARWIVLKTSEPLAVGELWQHLARPSLREKLVVVVSASELRKSNAPISEGLSWEATLESLLKSLAPGGELAALNAIPHLVVAFDLEGALWIDRGEPASPAKAHLVFRPEGIEDTRRHLRKDTVFGSLSCLSAAVAWYLARTTDHRPDLEAAIENGLSAMHDLLDRGHGRAAEAGAGFPAKRLAGAITEVTCRYARNVFSAEAVTRPVSCTIPGAPAAPASCWSLMHEALKAQGQGCPEPAWDLAGLVAQRGPIALGSLPHLSIGKLTSADREEIEALRVLRRLIEDYKGDTSRTKPLSIGIFGPPGAGKSFAVKAIAEALVGKDQWMEFNLSQFKVESAEDLIGAFHQVRDRVLKGQTPVAFFDEFDSREYRWLQYLLAPMQDGAFQEGQITHPVGRSIFVFAGGTSRTFASFGPPEGAGEAYQVFKMAKGPDFKSRLDGFLDVLGPNRRDIVRLSPDGTRYELDADACDVFYPVRRAFVVRGEFGCKPTDRLDIDPGVLRALLRVGKYRHGARSLSKVIEPLRAGLPGKIRRSLVPPRQQLALHVDADEFLASCRRAGGPTEEAPLETAARELLATAIHETWRALGKEGGWLATEDDVDFPGADDYKKDSSRAAAERVPKTLALIGLALAGGANTPEERERIRLKLEYHLELLAETEHAGWMDWHLDQGWQYGPKKEPAKKLHHCLKPYLKLGDVERNKDRDSIRHYLDFAAAARMKIVEAGRR